MTAQPRTLYQKIWDAHVVETRDDGTALIFIDRHLVHEVTSPQAFEALRVAGRKVRRPDLTLAVPDHNLPTTARRTGDGQRVPIADQESAAQLAALERNAPEFGIRYIGDADVEQGIVHVVGPEQGFSLPGATIVCGDSHTACHGGLGALAFGIGTSEVEHVLATQTLLLKQSKTMEVRVEGVLEPGVTAKDVVLHITGVLGAAGGTGHVIEYTGQVIRDLSIEGRLTVSNMAIEHGARAGLIAPDDKTFAYLKGRPYAPKGADWDRAVDWWRSLATDAGARYDKVVIIDAKDIAPSVTWGTSPEDVLPITGIVPAPESFADPAKQDAARASLRCSPAWCRHVSSATIAAPLLSRCTALTATRPSLRCSSARSRHVPSAAHTAPVSFSASGAAAGVGQSAREILAEYLLAGGWQADTPRWPVLAKERPWGLWPIVAPGRDTAGAPAQGRSRCHAKRFCAGGALAVGTARLSAPGTTGVDRAGTGLVGIAHAGSTRRGGPSAA